MIKSLIACALLVLVPARSDAALLSAHDLIGACAGDGTAMATCDGYLMAVTDAILQRESRGRTDGRVCVPETITIEQVRAAVLDFAKQKKAERASTGVALAVRAVRAAFPCEGAPKDP
jgi:hypothetical protein